MNVQQLVRSLISHCQRNGVYQAIYERDDCATLTLYGYTSQFQCQMVLGAFFS